ncbi:MAG: hypothetical protein AB7V50_03115 [Vampirovibrionia bacterium]
MRYDLAEIKRLMNTYKSYINIADKNITEGIIKVNNWNYRQVEDYSPARESFIKSEKSNIESFKRIKSDNEFMLQLLKEKYVTLGGKL